LLFTSLIKWIRLNMSLTQKFLTEGACRHPNYFSSIEHRTYREHTSHLHEGSLQDVAFVVRAVATRGCP
jgi:hypothetical protein